MAPRDILLVLGGWFAASFAFAALIIAASRRRDTDATRPVFVALDVRDPLDGLSPEERELFLEAWWQDVLAMPEAELDEDEHAYLRWVDSLPEVIA